MKNTGWKRTIGSLLGLAVLLVCSQTVVFGQEKPEEERFFQRIQGAWRTTVTPRNCQTGSPIAPAFHGFLVFHRGGTISGASAVVVSADGVWERENGRRNYSFATLSFLYGPTGTFVGTQQINQDVTLQNRNEFTSTGTFEVFDVNGNSIRTGCATSTGTRFE